MNGQKDIEFDEFERVVFYKRIPLEDIMYNFEYLVSTLCKRSVEYGTKEFRKNIEEIAFSISRTIIEVLHGRRDISTFKQATTKKDMKYIVDTKNLLNITDPKFSPPCKVDCNIQIYEGEYIDLQNIVLDNDVFRTVRYKLHKWEGAVFFTDLVIIQEKFVGMKPYVD
jgi:hypothetical protein